MPNIFTQPTSQLLGFPLFYWFWRYGWLLERGDQFPIEYYGNLVENLYHLLNTRTVEGNLLIDQLVALAWFLKVTSIYFSWQSLATFTSHDAIRGVVYVESRGRYRQKDGLPDLVKVSIIRPRYEGKIPAVMTASPYHQGPTIRPATRPLQYECRPRGQRTSYHSSRVPQLELVDPVGSAELIDEAEETLTISIPAKSDYTPSTRLR